MRRLEFVPPTPDWFDGVPTVIIVGTKSALGSLGAEFLPVPEKLYRTIVDDLKPSPDLVGSTLSTLAERTGFTQQIVVAAVTDVYSRHNSPARPDQFFTTLKSLIPANRKTSIFVAIENNDYAFSIGCAISRLLPLYSRKGYSKVPKTEEPRAKKAKQDTRTGHPVTVHFAVTSGPKEIHLDSIRAAAQAIRYAAKLVDKPTSEMTTTVFIEKAVKLVAPLRSVSTKIIRGEDLVKEGLNGIYGVGKAAVEPPALVILSYSPPDAKKTVAWVGKGIVYDTGGLSIKGSDFMCGMKRDMGGAAAILCAFAAAVASGTLNHTLHAVLCMAENAVGPLAQRPDDIVYMYSGKTVELNNTDAEGRLVLGDGIAYTVKNLNPDYIFDMATLTGAQGVATGKHHAAIVCNDDETEARTVAAGKRSGDLVFPLLYCPEFLRSEFKSDVADMKNSAKVRSNALASCAAQFIANHLGTYTKPWTHIDMASPVYMEERATGYGVALLLELIKML